MFVLLASLLAASPGPAPVPLGAVQLDGVPVSVACSMLLGKGLKVPFVLAPDVAADKRPVSMALPLGRARDAETAKDTLRQMGLSVKVLGGIWMIGKAPQDLLGVRAGPDLREREAARRASFQEVVYSPQYRDASTLAQQLIGVLPDLRVATRAADPATGGNVAAGDHQDFLVFSGDLDQRRRALMLLGQLDLPRQVVSIRATVYEVAVGKANGSAFDLVASVLGGNVTLSTPRPGDVATGGGAFRLQAGGIDAVVRALNSDSRFKLVSSPHLIARSGSEAVLTSGSQVPVLGSVAVPGAGQPAVQSIDYRDSGVTLRVRPVVHEAIIDLSVVQELSSFARTTTGVDGSPTLNRRALTNVLTARAGDVFVLGGLTQDRNSSTRRGFFRGFLGSRSLDVERSEILMVLQVDLGVSSPPARSEARTDGERAPGVNL